MKIVIQDTQVIYNNKIYTRKQHNDDIVPIFNYFWYTNNHRVPRSIEEKLEKEYQKTLIPTKTLNQKPIFNKVNGLLEKILSNSRKAYNSMNKRIITIELDKLQELIANGETPEEANPVGQKTVKSYIHYILRNHTKEAFPKNSIGEEKLLNHIMYIFNSFKPLTTTKEQPESKCKCTEGFQDVCENYINNGPLREHCSLNCTDNFRPLG